MTSFLIFAALAFFGSTIYSRIRIIVLPLFEVSSYAFLVSAYVTTDILGIEQLRVFWPQGVWRVLLLGHDWTFNLVLEFLI